MRVLSAVVEQLIVAPIRVYRFLVSPLLPRVCRFHPSCSAYALAAVLVHGPVRGVGLTVKRLLRCHPFHPGGFDPVPALEAVDAASILREREPRLARELAPSPEAAEEPEPTPQKPEDVSSSGLRKQTSWISRSASS